MTTPIPKGWHSVTPRLVVHDAARLVEFLKQAFDAKGDFRTDIPSEIRIGDSFVMVSSVGPRDPMPAFLYLYVDDIDATYKRALEAGAVSLEEPQDLPLATAAGWSKIRAATSGKSRLTKRTSRWTTSAGAPPPSPLDERAGAETGAAAEPALPQITRTGVDFRRGLHQAAPGASATGRHHVQCPNMDASPRQGWQALPHGRR
jgi:PhnB protein